MYLRVCVFVFTCVYVCIYLCVDACMHLYLRVCAYVFTCTCRHLHFNNHETKEEYLTASNQALQPSIREEHIEVICNTKYLGVQIDENLTWKNEIKSITEKASCAIGFPKFAKHFLPEAVVKTLYTSIVEPHFQY